MKQYNKTGQLDNFLKLHVLTTSTTSNFCTIRFRPDSTFNIRYIRTMRTE